MAIKRILKNNSWLELFNFQNPFNGIYLYFVNKHLSSWPLLGTSRKTFRFENVMEKGENAGYQHFSLFPKCFLPFLNQIPIFNNKNYFLSSANDLNLPEFKIMSQGKESKNLLRQMLKSFINCKHVV